MEKKKDNMRSTRILSSIIIAMLHIGRNFGIAYTFAFPNIQQRQYPSRTSRHASSKTTRLPASNKNRRQLLKKYDQHGMVAVDTLRGGDAFRSNTNGDQSILGRYSRFVDEKPLLAKSITAGIVTTLANIFSQVVVPIVLQQQQSVAATLAVISWRRVMMFLMTGFCFIGPYLHIWYGFLDRMLAMPQQSNTKRTAVKVIVDQTIGVCIFYPIYFVIMETAESVLLGRVPILFTALEKCRTELPGIAMMNWRIWPLTNAINFGLVPLPLRVLVNQVVSFFWFAYLSTR